MNRDRITVEQLNHSQWHAFNDGCAAKTGAISWVAAVAAAPPATCWTSYSAHSPATWEPASPRRPTHQPVARHVRTTGFTRVHRFEDSHALAAQYGPDWWLPIYRRAFPTLISAVAVEHDGWAQRGGIDRLLTLACGRTYTVDEKIRLEDWPDVLLERWSDEARKAPGWVQKPLAADFIAYAHAPAATCVLLPVAALQRAWRQHGRQWIGLYGQRRAQNAGYVSVSVPVPRGVLMQAIVEAMFVS